MQNTEIRWRSPYSCGRAGEWWSRSAVRAEKAKPEARGEGRRLDGEAAGALYVAGVQLFGIAME